MVSLDKIDRIILMRLQEDARISFRAIAKDAGVSEATIFQRVKKLRSEDVIKGFTTIVDAQAIGKPITAFILVKANPKTYPKMLRELITLNDIYEIYDVTGAYYAILKVRTSTTHDLAAIIDKIGQIEGVEGTETAIVLKKIKEETGIRMKP